ncbi:MAG: nucleoid-associated protein [Saprospiraceae bacterium]|nr:nucleoid-associated protein [Saprospiraceae bacterium]
MLDFSAARVLTACLHRIPHPGGDAALMLSEQLLDNSAIAGLEAHLAKLFKPFNVIDRQAFTELEENKVYNDISRIFKDVQALVPSSSEIAEYLYKLSDDPAIPSGDFLVVYFQDVQLDDEMLDAIGLYKWEKKHAYGSIKAFQEW